MINKGIICAGIVLYNPELKLLGKNIDAISAQVSKIYLYDNASDNIEKIEVLVRDYENIVLLKGSSNLGIAYALNVLIGLAKKDSYSWCLTLDQDSICADNLISSYLGYLSCERVALVCPFIINNNKYTFEEYKKLSLPSYTKISDPINCITSACLNNVKIIESLGGYREELFIDCVDTELNCRVLMNGFQIIRVNSTYLIQSMGQAKQLRSLTWLYDKTKLSFYVELKLFQFIVTKDFILNLEIPDMLGKYIVIMERELAFYLCFFCFVILRFFILIIEIG
nr:glycosyltransferase [Liquorilactobacillus satsumensis]